MKTCRMILLLVVLILHCCGGHAYNLGTLAVKENLSVTTVHKLENHQLLTRAEIKEVEIAEHEFYKNARRQGFDEVSNTNEAIQLRDYLIRSLKMSVWKGKNYVSQDPMSEILFPGQTPEEYSPGDEITVYSDIVNSVKTYVPYKYYHLPACRPTGESVEYQNLGATLLGHERRRTPYRMYTLEDMPCTPLCRTIVSGKSLRRMKQMIDDFYRIHLELDGLPVLMRSQELNVAYRGVPIGFPMRKSVGGGNRYYLYNHLKFTITYSQRDDQRIHITGFDVHPVSIDQKTSGPNPSTGIVSCAEYDPRNNQDTYLSLDASEKMNILYSYDVRWERNDNLHWGDRWDVYCLSLVGRKDRFERFYSSMRGIACLLIVASAMTCWLIGRLRKDLTKYTKQQKEEGESTTQIESGWKSVHGDVFRPPVMAARIRYLPLSSAMLLSVVVGSGSQVGLSFCLTIVLAISDVTQLMVTGQFLTSMIFLYAMCGVIAGFWSSRIYKLCCHNTEDLIPTINWRKNAIATATTMPFIFATMFVVLNINLGFVNAATCVGNTTMFNLFLVWGCISLPSVFAGAWIGSRIGVIKVPTETNQVARVVPKEAAPAYLKYGVPLLLGGFLPFVSLIWELPRVICVLLNGLNTQAYLEMDFLLILLTCSTVFTSLSSIVLCYLQLCAEDHRWWWKAFANAGATGLYLFLYSLWYAFNEMETPRTLISWMVYLTTMTMLSIAFVLFYGSVGFLSCLWFTRAIYGTIETERPNSDDECLLLIDMDETNQDSSIDEEIFK